MRVLITGAGGLVGTALARLYRDHDVSALSHRELDITDAAAVAERVRRLRPDVAFNCAVIGVDECEADPALAERINVQGPALLAAACERLVHFSSNYVFDGRRDGGAFYTAEDEARPINVYGETKLRGERAVTAASSRAIVVRTSWVYGPGKQNFLATAGARLARGERVDAITDTFASTTYVEDLVARVAELVERDRPGVYQVVNDGVCSYADFARHAARLLGADSSFIALTTEASLQRAAPRPRWTPMQCDPPLRRWEDALADYLAERGRSDG